MVGAAGTIEGGAHVDWSAQAAMWCGGHRHGFDIVMLTEAQDRLRMFETAVSDTCGMYRVDCGCPRWSTRRHTHEKRCLAVNAFAAGAGAARVGEVEDANPAGGGMTVTCCDSCVREPMSEAEHSEKQARCVASQSTRSPPVPEQHVEACGHSQATMHEQTVGGGDVSCTSFPAAAGARGRGSRTWSRLSPS